MADVSAIIVRPFGPDDWGAVWEILRPVFRAGDTYAIDPDIDERDARDYWTSNGNETFVAESTGEILGTYYIRPNQAGGGRHICNCGYITGANAVGRGVARAMCAHSIDHAKDVGYRGMQFNFVVSSNVRAVELWKRFGFDVVGRLPLAFEHPTDGFVDALVMFRAL